ncbi:hypothetical protein [Streptomyces sioyaensis]|uniref:hypothetical protein n=1 Tax=Streptomyces sioyaensis TaxID=67364 RepID=UPI0037AA9335
MPGFTALLQLDVAGLEAFADQWATAHRKVKEARTGFHDDQVRKRYDWGIPSEHRATVSGGGPGPLGMSLEQADIAHLHSSGMARDFDVSGSSDELTAHS